MKISHKAAYILLIFIEFINYNSAFSQLYINEFAASNATIIEDPDYNDDADWIEIYNAGNSIVNLRGYYLTDNLNNPDKWRITDNINIAPKGYIVFWADGMDNGIHTNFKISALGEEIGLYNPDLITVDSVIFSFQEPDITQGRNKNNLNQWVYYLQPTPNSANSDDFYTEIVYSSPEFFPIGGLYLSDTSVELMNNMGGTIKYTLDGSEPTINSTEYNSPIQVDTTTIIRARIYQPDMIPGPIITHTYFINEGFEERNLPVVSISTNETNFWDKNVGIYVQDFKPDWEIPVNIELFENDGSDRAAFNERAGIKVNGLYSWRLPQKMLGIYFRGQYGSGNLAYPLILNTYRSSYKTFALRASGSDWSYTLFRDILGQQATKLNMNLDISESRPCIVYVNGEYMGIHNIREKIETDYIEKNHKLEAETFDLVENEDYAEAGSLAQYNELLNLLKEDLSNQANFDKVAAKMDIENFTNLVITEMAVANTSINHNVMAWKPKNNGKWKWVVMDLDRGFFSSSNNLIDYYLGQNVWPLKDLFKNNSYKEYFGQKLADHLYTSFHPAHKIKLIEEHMQAIEAEIPNHVERWLGTTSSYGNAMPSVNYWYKEVCDLKSFVQARPMALLSDLESYGFDGTVNLMIGVVPSNAGYITINNLKIPEPDWTGPYLKNVSTQLRAIDKPGYKFKGWINTEKKDIIALGSDWKYLDDGSNQGDSWYDTSFNDALWNSGAGQFGYGEGDENTVISYGSDSQEKFVTSYFRHTFNLNDADLIASNYMINILVDDGAIVYLNGVKIINYNMGCSNVSYGTFASTSISGQSESEYSSFIIDKSLLEKQKNVLAVEVHQSDFASSDLSFDLELVAYFNNNNGYVSTNNNYSVTLTEDINLTAVYEETGVCIIPEIIAENITLNKSCSPYLVQGDITILPGVTLSIEPGVEILMPENANIFVNGKINALGSNDERIIFKLNPKYIYKSWGAINFVNTNETSNLSFVTIEDASRGPVPVRVGAISAFHANLNLDNMIIKKVYDNPISVRYSDIKLTNSSLHSEVTGDLINVKYGKAIIENCIFTGNNKVDADGIDYDDVENGIIKNCKIYNFVGINNDAVDIGEKASNILIDSLIVYNVFDKGVSIGQQSSVSIKNSTFINCNMGVGAKDSSLVTIDQCTFYNNAYPIKCYEKNPGSAGGNVKVTNSILSNSSEESYFADSKSSLNISSSLSDNDSLPESSENIFGNPLFVNPTFYDYQLNTGSPCILAGNENGIKTDLGSHLQKIDKEPSIMINQVYINSLTLELPEFISLYNPSSKTVDISDYKISKGVTCTIPKGIKLGPGESIYIAKYLLSTSWKDFDKQLIQWSSGKLSNNGEGIQVEDKNGIVIDYIKYKNDGKWPVAAFEEGEIMSLKFPELDNHFPENWESIPVGQVLEIQNNEITENVKIYPNPSTGYITIIAPNNTKAQIFSIMGTLLNEVELNGPTQIYVSIYNQKIVFIRCGDSVNKVVLIK